VIAFGTYLVLLAEFGGKVTAKKIPNTLFPLHGTELGTTPNLLGSLEELGTSMVFTKEPLFVLTA
jgi:hypothetical protein